MFIYYDVMYYDNFIIIGLNVMLLDGQKIYWNLF